MSNTPNGAAPKKRPSGGNNFFRMRNRFQAKRDTGPRQSAVSLLIPTNSSSSTQNLSEQNSNVSTPSEPRSITISNKQCAYTGWPLYFPEIGIHKSKNISFSNLIKKKMFSF